MEETDLSNETENLRQESFDDEIELRRLGRSITLAEKYFLYFASCNQLPKQKELIKKLKTQLKRNKIAVIEFKKPITNLLSELRKRLKTKNPDAVIVTGLRYSIASDKKAKDSDFIANINISRDDFPSFLDCPLILFLPEYAISKLMNGAPDFFSVRSGIFYFENDEKIMSREISDAISLSYEENDALNYLERQQKINNLQELLIEYQSLPENKRDKEIEYQLKDKLADIYHKTANYLIAEKLIKELLAFKLDKNAKETANQYNNLGNVYYSQGDYPKAEENYLKSLQIWLNIFGENHPNTATSYNNLGNVYDSQGDYPKAEENHLKSLQIKLNIFGENHSNTATSYNNLGNVYNSQGDYPKAEENHLKALQIRLNIFGENHPDTAVIYNNLGELYENQDKLTDAEIYYEKALEIYRKFLRENHFYIQTVKNNLESVRKKMGK